jgi:single-stranded-DNA-specific exonuclease
VSKAGLEMGRLDVESISYALAPRLNAPGRLGHAIASYELLITQSEGRGEQLAAQLEGLNAERQRLTLEALHKAKERLNPDASLFIVGGEDFPAGVLGVAASKLVDEYYRPAVVLELGSEISRGSARSIPEFNITAALTECHDLLLRFGGHAQAAGFTLPSANVAPLRERLVELARQRLADVELHPVLTIDAELPLSALSGDTFKLIERLAPFGVGNPAPTFLARRVKVADYHYVGSGGEHLKLKLQDGKVIWDAIGFGLGNLAPGIASYLDIVYNLGIDRWEGGERLQLNILDFSPKLT